ncbi:Phosphoribosylaminoimidazole-succinocarboxamide synthase [Ochrobactrum soli]|uniref:Phosphoribosylaminoimidazole-succinocarboxamide synthase n=1 Tax=Ochrobactrum soli TaxID=2448455 RepID=A0A2P9HCQ6_9HYPH|nr:Phosphoribosylaminoimidazole-succinocarboxamide synthase [[Ochrobactrum] soli]
MSTLRILPSADIPELPNRYNGKVRENYDLPDGSRIIISTDRLSAFDVILTSIPFKGQVLTQTASYWFEETADICPNHVLAYPDPNVVIGRRLDILPVEVVVRGYLAGTTSTSILTKYRKGERQMYGVTLPDGLKDNEKLPHPIITPTSKAFDGGHDEPLSGDEILEQGLLTAEQWETVSRYALALFERGQARAAEHGLILVDTKYEFGTDASGHIILADEIHTPDSSRYWIADSYEESFAAGTRPASFDKDFVRAWVTERCDPYNDPIPEIPLELIEQTSKVYIQAYEQITGKTFVPDLTGETVLDRVRANLEPYFVKKARPARAKPTTRAPRKKAEPKAAVVKPVAKETAVTGLAVRKRYTPAERAAILAAVAKATENGKATLKAVLQHEGVSEQTYYNWKNAAGKSAAPAAATPSAGDDLKALLALEAENLKLRKELAAKLRAENAELRRRLGKA